MTFRLISLAFASKRGHTYKYMDTNPHVGNLCLLAATKMMIISSTILSAPCLGHMSSNLPKVIFLAVAEAEGEGGKTLALQVEAEVKAKT